MVRARFLASGADDYYGPGGLSARQIFDKVQQARARDAADARQSSKASRSRKDAQPPPAAPLSEEALARASSKELRALLLAKSVDVSDCFERADLVARARAHLG